MKRYIAVLITIILLIIPITSCSSIPDLVPKILAANTQETVAQVEADSTDVFAEIQKNIDLVTALKTKVENDRIQNKPLSIDAVIKDIQTVSASYDKLSSQHDAIRQGLLKKIANVEDMQKKVSDEITILKQRRATYAGQLRKVSDPNPDIVRTRQAALVQTLKYMDAQIALCTQFGAIEADITDEMTSVQKTIDSFLNMIDNSAVLFKEGLNLLVLQRDINNALSLFTQDLPRMEQLSTDMEHSWSNLDYLVDALTSVSTVNIKQ